MWLARASPLRQRQPSDVPSARGLKRARVASAWWSSCGPSAPRRLERDFVDWSDVSSLSGGGENRILLQINIERSTVNKVQPQGGRSLKENYDPPSSVSLSIVEVFI